MTPKRRNTYLLRKFDISLVEYKAILKAQHGRCGVCGKFPKKGTNLHVDHEHSITRLGKRACVRGLVHGYCNRWLVGKLTSKSVGSVFEYLTNPPAKKVLQ